MNQECGLNRGRYHCPLCPKNYSRKEHLFRHNLFKHSDLQIEKGKPGRPAKPRISQPEFFKLLDVVPVATLPNLNSTT